MGAVATFRDCKDGSVQRLTSLASSVADAERRARKDDADRFAFVPKGGTKVKYFVFVPLQSKFVKCKPFTS